MKTDYSHKLSEFREAVLPASSVLILTHDYPDPDCLASACGISELLSFWGVSSVISFGGFVGRAENRAMIRFLNIRTVPFVLISGVSEFERIILVDCYPGNGNVSLSSDTAVHAVIDHHPNIPKTDVNYFHDIREDYGSTSTIVTGYLLQAGCPIPQKLATALFYGIKTDTADMSRNANEKDVECYKSLFNIMDYKLLSKIEKPDRDIEFFHMLHKATEAAICYDSVGYAHIGSVTAPDYIAEMADLLHRLEKLEWMICTGVFKNQIFFSIRSKNSSGAGTIAEKLSAAFGGSGGGHSRFAAGRMPIQTDVNILLEKIELVIKDIFNIKTAVKETLL